MLLRAVLALVLALAGLVSAAPLFAHEAGPAEVLTQSLLAVPWKPHKRSYTGSANQNMYKFVNERKVDSYFRLRESAGVGRPDAEHARTEPPHRQHDVKDTEETRSPNHHLSSDPPRANIASDVDLRKPHRDYFKRQRVYERPSVGSRFRKPVFEASFHRSDRGPRAQRGAPVKDKTLYKATVGVLASAPRGPMKEFHKRDTVDERRGTLSDVDGGGAESGSYAAFYGMNPEEGEGAAYYRGGASNFVDILTERKGAKTIGARAGLLL